MKKRLSAAPLQNQSPKQQPSNNTEKETNVTQMKEVAIENVAKGMEALKLKEERYDFLLSFFKMFLILCIYLCLYN